MGTDWVLEHYQKTGFITSDEEEEEELDFIKYQYSIVQHFKNMVTKISSHYPDRNIIIHPHPSEDHKTRITLQKIWKTYL